MDTSAVQLDPNEMRNLAISLGSNAPPPSVAAPISMPSPQAPSDLGISTSAPHVNAPRGTIAGDTTERGRLLSTGAGEDQIYGKIANSNFGQQHPTISKILGGLGEGIAKAGDIGLSAVAPALAINLPGTEYHHQAQLNQVNRQIGTETKEGEQQAQTANIQSEIPVHDAQREAQEAEIAAKTPIEITPEQAETIGSPELAGVKVPSAVFAALSKQHGVNTTRENVTGQNVAGREKVADTAAESRENVAEASAHSREGLAEAANKTRMLIAQMRDNTSRANNENTVAHRGAGVPGKVPADVTKRAGLANNVLENAGAVDDLLKRNPAIVGAVGGRASNVQDMIGSDDPDIAELGVRMHNIALASNGAHGIRSAEAIRQTEDELFKNFKRGPEGIHSALNATRGSMQTFLDDEKGFQDTGKRNGASHAPDTTPNSGLSVNLKDAMALPSNKGKSEADVRKDIEAHGHKVVE